MHLRNELINKLKTCAKQLTHGAVKLLIFLAKNCDDTGYVRGVYYKEFCDLTNMCNQSFYNAKKKLIELGFIRCEKVVDRDIDFYMIDNSIVTVEERKEGYVPFDTNFFENPEIFALTDNALILALEFLKNSGANKNIKKSFNDNTVRFGSFRKDWREFIRYYCQDVFNICEVQLKNYLKSLKNYFSMGVKEKVFFATPLVESVKKFRNSKITSVDKKIAFRTANVALDRLGLSYDKKKKQLNFVIDNLVELILQYKAYAIAIFSNSSNATNATGKSNSGTCFSEIASVLEKALRYTIKCAEKGEMEDFLASNIKFLHKNLRHNLGLGLA